MARQFIYHMRGLTKAYPGGKKVLENINLSFYPDAPRINTVVRNCDMHGSVLAYSGSMGNAVRITRNHIYGNTAGISTDTVSASGHIGYPADSVMIRGSTSQITNSSAMLAVL